jgi:hypothetical protein
MGLEKAKRGGSPAAREAKTLVLMAMDFRAAEGLAERDTSYNFDIGGVGGFRRMFSGDLRIKIDANPAQLKARSSSARTSL